VDAAMGLRMVRSVTARTCIADPEVGRGQAGVVLSLYVFDPAVEAVLPGEDELREVARLLREQIEAFRALRPVLAAAAAACAMRAARDVADQVERIGEVVRQILHADAVTILGRPSGTDTLHVIGATSPLDYPTQETWYDLEDGSGSAWLAKNP